MEIEGRINKKLSKEFTRTENRMLGALSRLDDFLQNPLIQSDSGSAPDASRNALCTNQGTNEDDSQSDPHHEARVSHSRTTQVFSPDDSYYRPCDRHWCQFDFFRSFFWLTAGAVFLKVSITSPIMILNIRRQPWFQMTSQNLLRSFASVFFCHFFNFLQKISWYFTDSFLKCMTLQFCTPQTANSIQGKTP